MIELFPAKCCDEILHCGSSVWTGIVMNHHNTPAKHAMLLILDCAMQFLKCVAIVTCIDCGALRQEVHKQNAFPVPKHCAHYVPSWSGLLEFVFVGDEVFLHTMDCCFDSVVVCNTHVLSSVTTWFKKFIAFLTVSCQKSNALACHFNLCSSVSIFSNQHAHTFWNVSLSDTISWRSDCEIWGKCRDSDIMVNRLFSLIFYSTARTKSSFTTDSRPLRGSSCTFSHPSLNSHTHLRTIELLVTCSPYTSHNWQWISVSVVSFTSKKQITDHISHAAGFSIFLNIINKQHDA